MRRLLCCVVATWLAAGLGAAAQTSPAVVDIRIHGNYVTPDAEVIRLSGVQVGQPLPEGGIDAVVKRLEKSHRFASVEARVRFRSLDESTGMTVVIMVEEYPTSVIDVPAMPSLPAPPGPLRRLGNSSMFSPILDYVDGYGLTYGVRTSFVHLLGKNGRLSMPLSWGARKQAAIEAEKTFDTGPVSRVAATGAWTSRENPAFDETDDNRLGVGGEVTIPVKRRMLNATLNGNVADVSFGDLDDQFVQFGAGLTLDTRKNPAFPRNAVLLSAAWRSFDADSGPRINRYRYEGQGYVGLVGSTVLAIRGLGEFADGSLPLYEKSMAGGSATLRGFRAGAFAGDNLAAGTVEVRIPTHSPMRLGQTGFTVFADAATAYDHGTTLDDATWHYGVGGGWYVKAPLVNLNLDVAYGIDRKVRAHVNVSFKF